MMITFLVGLLVKCGFQDLACYDGIEEEVVHQLVLAISGAALFLLERLGVLDEHALSGEGKKPIPIADEAYVFTGVDLAGDSVRIVIALSQ